MSFCTPKMSSVTEALRRALHQRYIAIYLWCFTKKMILKAFKIRKSAQVSRNGYTPKSLPVMVFYTKKSGRPAGRAGRAGRGKTRKNRQKHQ